MAIPTISSSSNITSEEKRLVTSETEIPSVDNECEVENVASSIVSQELQEIKAKRASLEDDDNISDNIWERTANHSIDLNKLLKHKWFIAYTISLMMLAIMWSYHFAGQHRRVAVLEIAVRDMHNKSLFSTAERIRMERVASIQNQIEQLGLNLGPATRPPYMLSSESQSE